MRKLSHQGAGGAFRQCLCFHKEKFLGRVEGCGAIASSLGLRREMVPTALYNRMSCKVTIHNRRIESKLHLILFNSHTNAELQMCVLNELLEI